MSNVAYFSFVDLSFLPRKHLIKVNLDFKSKPCFSQQVKFWHQSQPLSLYVRAKRVDHLLFSPSLYQKTTLPPGNQVRKKFLYLFILGFWTHEIIWKPFCWPVSFLTQTSIFCQIAHHQSLLSYLNKHFPRGCAFCLLLKFFAENYC